MVSKSLQVTQKHVSTILFVTQGVGVAFTIVFLAAYMGGLPSTNVLHSEPVFRAVLAVFGAAFLVLILAVVLLAAYLRNKPVSV